MHALTAQVQSSIGITILGKRHSGKVSQYLKLESKMKVHVDKALQEKFCKAEQDGLIDWLID
jgi:hypothetical protein